MDMDKDEMLDSDTGMGDEEEFDEDKMPGGMDDEEESDDLDAENDM